MNELGQNIVHPDTLANLLAEKISLKEKNIEELFDIANRYPYFGVAQFLLAKKLNTVENSDTSKQLQQCALYFSNPFWFHYLLSEDELRNESSLNESFAAINKEILLEDPQEKIEKENRTYSQPDGTSSETSDIIDNEEQPDKKNKGDLESNPTSIIEEESKSTSQSGEAAFLETSNETQIPNESSKENTEETKTHPIEKFATRNKTEEKNFEPIESVANAVEEVIKKNQENTIEEIKEDKPSLGINEDAEREKLSKLIEQHLTEFKKPIESIEEIPITAKVYHAIDYFASQGIKLDPRLISEDKLGNKVKKFTDWLKQMKRVNENPTDLGTDAETEQLIEKIAQTSNETKDIITETMAQVLIKQGKIEKAVQLYQKLSFLNPSKTTYFAAKINELKDIK